MTVELSVASIHRRFLVLTAARWLPVGLWIPVVVLFTLDRGLTLVQFGAVASVQGLVVLALELPTGALADSIGRRRVLVIASAVSIVSTAIYLSATNPTAFLVAFALQGIYRALDSGPLEAWYVDATLAADPTAPIERGLSAAGMVLGVSIAVGAVVAGGLVALGGVGPVDALAVPIVVSLAMQVVALVAVAVLMTETRPAPGTGGPGRAALAAGAAVADGLRLLRWSPVLMALVAVELTWGFGMVAFESLFPVRLDEIVGSGDEAAAILGPVAAAAWLASAAGAAVVPWLGRRLGMAPAAALMRVLQGLSVVGIGLAVGVVGAVTAYLVCYAIHGASNPAHQTLVHGQVQGPLRATVVSLNSMASHPAYAVGLLVLPALAGATSVSPAMYVAAGVLALGSLLYIPAWRQRVAGADQSLRTTR